MTNGARDEHSVVIARAVFPEPDSLGVMPLYVDEQSEGAVIETTRESIVLQPNAFASLGSYFNSFPAAYWAAYSSVSHVLLTATLRGRGTLRVLRSDNSGRVRVLVERDVDGEVVETLRVGLADFVAGGCCWLDLQACVAPFELRSADWRASRSGAVGGRALVGITTFNRPEDCVRQLRALAADAMVMREVVGAVVIVDQSAEPLASHPRFSDAAQGMKDTLRVIRQGNFGGSGGFARVMAESLTAGVQHCLLLDDDAVVEPEAILRAVRFADFAASPVIVGSGMLQLDAPTVLYSQSERWDSAISWVDLRRHDAYNRDLAERSFRSTPALHAVERADYAGWWMCLLPVELLRRGGLAAPFFLKGDDIEFGLRASALGVRTVSIPGIALWHMGWEAKVPTRTWEAYFLHRNRIITALLHSPHARGGLTVLHSFLGDVKLLLQLQYSAVHLRALAVDDALAPLALLPGRLASRVGEVRSLWSAYSDARVREVPLPAPVHSEAARPHGTRRSAVAVVTSLVRHLIRRAPVESAACSVEPDELGWWTFSSVDSAEVRSPAGGSARYQRSRAVTRRFLLRSLRLHLRLWCVWPAAARRARAAVADVASADAWERIFAGG